MGLGLGIGQGQRGSNAPENTVKLSIKERVHIRAVRNGLQILAQPYALLTVGGTRALHAVIVRVEGDTIGGWVPETIPLSDLSDVKLYDLPFIPNDAFDGAVLDGVIAVVEQIDPFADSIEGAAGQD